MFGKRLICFLESVTGRVHATDYSNASSTGIFDSYQVWCMLFLLTVSLFVGCDFFLNIPVNVTFFTDVLEWLPLLSCFSASLYFP